MSSSSVPKTIILKSPDSDKIREVIITSVLLPKCEKDNRPSTAASLFSSRGNITVAMERRMCKRRLDHLTPEEKIMRKKLKNREAAQTSRDKKKARMEELEASLAQLQNENEILHEEIQSLKDDKESLARENARLTEEVWRLSVASGPSESAVFSPLPQGVCPLLALPHPPLLRLLALLLSIWMTGIGLTQKPLPLLLKNLNNLQTRSLLKLTMMLKYGTETPKENLVGQKAESLEPCWTCFENNDIIPTCKKTSVTYPKQKHHKPTVSNLDCNIGKGLKDTCIKTSEIAVDTLRPQNLPSSTDITLSNQITSDEVKLQEHPNQIIEIPSLPMDNDMKLITYDEHEISFPEECMDCVVNEEIVETTESDVTVNSPIPLITLTESEDMQTVSETSDFSEHLLAPKDLMEESSSDHGYESYDSPISEPDQLVNLFPELW